MIYFLEKKTFKFIENILNLFLSLVVDSSDVTLVSSSSLLIRFVIDVVVMLLLLLWLR